MMKNVKYFGIFTALVILAGAVSLEAVKLKKTLPPSQYPGITCPPAIDDSSTWLWHDNGSLVGSSWFEVPDLWDDHYYNVRFVAPDSCRLLQAAFLFMMPPGDTTSTTPDVHVLVWDSDGLLPTAPDSNPGLALDSVIVPDSLIKLCPNNWTPETTYVSLAGMNLHFNATDNFHVGWEPDFTDTTDEVLALKCDNDYPWTNFSCEWWGESIYDTVNAWGTILENWDRGVNLFIRVQVELLNDPSGVVTWLSPEQVEDFNLQGPYPNPFNPQTTLVVQLQTPQSVQMEAYDLQGRLVEPIFTGALPAGRNEVNWLPKGLPSGMYLVRLHTGTKTFTAKALLMK